MIIWRGDADRKEDVENDLDDDCGDSCDSDEVRYAHQGRLFWIIVYIRVPIPRQGIPRARYDAVRLGEVGGPGSPKPWHTPDAARCRSDYPGLPPSVVISSCGVVSSARGAVSWERNTSASSGRVRLRPWRP